MNKKQTAFIEELYAIATTDGLMTREEARTLIRSVRSETQKGLPDAVSNVVGWAHKVRTAQAVLDVILKLGEAGAVDHAGRDPDPAEPALQACAAGRRGWRCGGEGRTRRGRACGRSPRGAAQAGLTLSACGRVSAFGRSCTRTSARTRICGRRVRRHRPLGSAVGGGIGRIVSAVPFVIQCALDRCAPSPICARLV